MRCDEFETRLNELLDRRIAPDDDSTLCSHAHRCRKCADSMAAHLAVTAALRDLPPESPDEAFRFAVMNQLVNEQAAPVDRRRWQWTIALVATAASALLAFTLWRGAVNPGDPSGLGEDVVSIELPPEFNQFAEETQQIAAHITTRQLEVMSEFAEGIKPVATSFGAAYDALRHTLSGNTGAATATSG
jgi:hypothetical protein